MYYKNKKIILLTGFAVFTQFMPFQSFALEGDASYNFGVGFSDNIRRAPVVKDEETFSSVGLDVSAVEGAGRSRVDFETSLEYVYYAGDAYDSELLGGLYANVEYDVVPGRIHWYLRDNFGQRQQNLFTALTPDNRENVNFLTTGPIFDLLSSPRNTARVHFFYSRVDFEESPTDNERFGTGLRLGREVRRGHTLSIVGTTLQVEFADDASGTDFDRNETYLSYQIVGSRNEVGIDAGYNEIDRGVNNLDGPLVRFYWDHDFTQTSTLRMTAGSEYSDEGSLFQLFQDEIGDLKQTAGIVNNSNPFLNNYVSASYSYIGQNATTTYRLSRVDADFEDGTGTDRDSVSASVQLQKDLTEKLFGGVRFTYRHIDFVEIDRTTENWTVALSMGYRDGAFTDLEFRYQYATRADSTGLSEYDENRYFLRLTYLPRWAR